MHMFLRVIAGILCVGVSVPAAAADWQQIYDTSTGTTYVDLQSIRSSQNGLVSFWKKSVKSSPIKMSGELVDTIVRKEEMDCQGQRARTVASRWYYKDAHVWGADWLGDWSANTPDTNGEALMEFVCSASKVSRD